MRYTKYEPKDWRVLWKAALRNMPAMAIVSGKECKIVSRVNGLGMSWVRPSYRRGTNVALRICLGYGVYNEQGRSNAASVVYVAIQRGSKPRGAARQPCLGPWLGRTVPPLPA